MTSGAASVGSRAVGSGLAAAAAVRKSVSGSGVLDPGAVLGGRYEILGVLGHGGMGLVYKAYDRDIERPIALKVIHPELSSHPELLQRFKQELLLARQIAHKNVVRIFDLRESQGIKFITMEYVDGLDLATLLSQKRKFPAAEAIEIIRQVCSGLAAAHGEQVIHRDLKPSNIMRDQNGRVVIMDFGLARGEQMAGLTRTGALLGTVEYMSPEQAKGEDLDPRSDIFATGLIFYELLTGKAPYYAESAVASLLKRTQGQAAPASEIDPTVPKRLSAIVSKCLERTAKDRYQTIDELKLALDALEGRAPAASIYAGVSARTAKTALLGTIAVVCLLAAIAGIWLWRSRQAPARHAPVTILVTDFANDTGEAVFDGALEPAFNLALEGAPFISSLDEAAAHRIAVQLQPGTTRIDESLGRLIATREGASVVISGSIQKSGSAYLVKVRAEDALTGKTVAQPDIKAGREQVLIAMGELAAKVRKALGDSTPESAQMAAAETFTTSSLEAAHEYALGQQDHFAGRYKDAIDHFQRSLEADPNLGRADSGIAVCLVILGRQQDAIKYYKLALSKIDRMSEREKYRTLGTYYTVIRDTDKAIEELTQLIQRYPADNTGHANLALAYFYRRDMQKALDEDRRALEISPGNVLQRNNLGLYAMYAGDFETAIREQKAVLQQNPVLVKGFVGIALSQAAQGQIPQAADTYGQLGKIKDGASTAAAGLADLALYEGATAEAETILAPAIDADVKNNDPDDAANKLMMFAQADLASRHKLEAIQAADRALAISSSDAVLFFAARTYLASGSPALETKASALAHDLTQRTSADSHAYGKLVLGEIELQHNRSQGAIKQFKDALDEADAWMVRFDLGRAYLAGGQAPEADSELELCLKRRGEVTALFLDEVPTVRFLPEVYYYLGRAQQDLNSPAAADSYKTFLGMRSKASDDPLVSYARAGMATLSESK